ncbi:triple tyrosine motif-containing protein [Plebeiibacterium marinum]|uniref:LuxR C-terminal-related transcriptional regulator n=1 Tax=Plebeiibacterium marinum TaxID=2992111 RepID=A0AAE3SKI3_9BACT|nr:triple tyrosine motif-containing protein [Plebeiobacterium marinum]MCW3806900.1 LuxR C-terminal-related transcriptional regulator [Plebeiobacterium marinum]
MIKAFRFLLFWLIILNGSLATSQNSKIGIPEIEYYNRRVYHAATQNWDITQGATEMMYFANNTGMLEYDGTNWKKYSDFGGVVMRCVQAVGDKIYTGAYNEIGYYSPDENCNLVYKSLVQDPRIRELEDFWSIHSWNNKVVFLSLKGLCIYENDKLQSIIPSSSRFISSFVVNGLLLVQDEKDGLMEIRGDKCYHVANGKVLSGKQVSTIMSLSESELLIGTINDGFYIWDMQNIYPWEVSSNKLLKEVNIYRGQKYSEELFAIGTIQGGLVMIDRRGDVFMQIDKDRGLNNNTLLSIFVDREGNIWGGLDNGIVKINFNSSISFLQGYYNLGTGYTMDKFGGDYYFGTNQALYKISEEGFRNPLKDRDDFERIAGTEGQVWSVYHDENTLLCGHTNGVFQVKGNKGELLSSEEISGVWVFKRVPGHEDLLMLGTYSGLIVLEKKDGKWHYRNKVKGFDESSRFLEFDSFGNLWVSHGYRGIYKMHINEGITEVKDVMRFKNEEVADNKSSLVLSKINGECIFTSEDGVYSYDLEESSFVRNKKYETIFEKIDFPNSIIQDDYRNLWCFSSGTTYVLRYLEDGSYRKIEYPFLPLHQKLVNAFESLYIEDADNVFFGIEDGFAHYSSDAFKNYKTPFNVHIRSFQESKDSVSYFLHGNVLSQQAIPEFPFKKNAFEISYAATFFEDLNIEYTTNLKGYDSYHSTWTRVNKVNYANLHEGEYVFEVKAKNSYGIESLPIQFKFVVLPPWHRSTSAKTGFAILFVVLLALVYYFFSKRIELSRQKEKAKQQERFRIKEEQLKNAALVSEKEMIRLRNEKLRSEMVFKEKELANSTVHIIQKNDFLSEIKDQLKRIVKVGDKNEWERKVRSLIKKIDRDIANENNWEVFETHFGQVHEAFFQRLKEKHPELTSREQKLCAYVKMGMASKDIASLMNITTRAVENNRSKLRQKLGMVQGDNLLDYIEQL